MRGSGLGLRLTLERFQQVCHEVRKPDDGRNGHGYEENLCPGSDEELGFRAKGVGVKVKVKVKGWGWGEG